MKLGFRKHARRDEPAALLQATDEELLRRYRRRGDRAAFAELVRRYETELYAYLHRYLNDGTLAEEARVGRALALQKLGRRAEEREAWTQLLLRHPHSVQEERARARLQELR